MQPAKQDIDWQAVRAGYEDPTVSLARLCRDFGLHRTSLNRRAAREGWVRSTPRPGRGDASPRTLAGRLRRVVSRQIEHLEQAALAPAKGSALAAGERVAKVAAGLVKVLEQLAQLEGTAGRRRPGPDKDIAEPDEHHMREQIARRLEALLGGPRDPGDGGEPAGGRAPLPRS